MEFLEREVNTIRTRVGATDGSSGPKKAATSWRTPPSWSKAWSLLSQFKQAIEGDQTKRRHLPATCRMRAQGKYRLQAIFDLRGRIQQESHDGDLDRWRGQVPPAAIATRR
jgi:acyl-CoA-binding protein